MSAREKSKQSVAVAIVDYGSLVSNALSIASNSSPLIQLAFITETDLLDQVLFMNCSNRTKPETNLT